MLPARRRALVAAWTRRLLVLGVACLVAYAARRTFFAGARTLPGDGQTAVRYWELARASFARGDGFPLWDRSECGGLPFVGNPEAPFVSALFAALFGVGGEAMARWYATLGIVVAITGVYAWARRVFALSTTSALFSGAIFGASGFVCGHFAGHASFVPFALTPWILLLARLGEDDPRAALGAGALLGLSTLEGGSYATPYTLLALAITEGPRLLSQGRASKVLRLGALVLASFALVAGVKLYPALVELARHPRRIPETDHQAWTDLIPAFIETRAGGPLGHAYDVDEYRAYVGPLVVGFAIAGAGAALILKPRRLEAVLLLVVGLVLARGAYGDTAPYAWLAKLPIFDQLRVPSRWLVLALFGAAIVAGVALDAALNIVAKGRLALQGVMLVVASIAIADPLLACGKLQAQLATASMPPRLDVATTPFRYVDGRDGRVAEYPARDVGTVTCPTKAWDFPEAKGLAPGAPLASLDPGAGSIGKIDVAQNRYEIELRATRPTTLHVHGSFDADWRSDAGVPRRALDGQLDLPVPAGSRTIVLSYRPVAFVLGAVATCLGVLGLGAAMWLLRPSRRKASARL